MLSVVYIYGVNRLTRPLRVMRRRRLLTGVYSCSSESCEQICGAVEIDGSDVYLNYYIARANSTNV